jgi:8-oxo-dGTP pyrophosphatase MutT (NUDIX family)
VAEEDAEVLAAGGVVCRSGDNGPEVVLVHRPKYDDWSLPKGKLDPGEDFEQAALREVEEETGMRCRLGEEIGEARYRDHKGRSKLVRYWAMQPESDGGFEPNDEVDELRWVTPEQARTELTYGFDRELIERAARRIGS